ncbi:hypothetical protein [Gimesia chilikensis]|uniref:Uncharacterized protein n=1 Tax=Gimesia chilikensis TaxID=2605989 RepID=A0A517PZ09_9PLAN|nr:hypothetical protein [Gimesia chilikensis]QDT24597.1 hypothetical protein HG66A1_64310 [Gimesia chilikensis]
MGLISKNIYRTLQGYNLTKFDGPIHRDRGFDKNNAQLSEAKNTLYQLIGDDQVVWLEQYHPKLFDIHIDCYIHEILVDQRDIIAIIDTFIWNHLIGNSRYIPEKAHEVLRDTLAFSEVEDDFDIVQLEDRYLAENLPPKNQLWSKVVKPDISDDTDQILTQFPLRYSQFLSITRVTKKMVTK